ncbi:type II toxin-antitoxin system RelE/ParE family toxin [Hypericibacter sp.]|uniref:type II toxin-antitoxin system RelE/ParE family toxin n=1 Tax=Hypericibacter sp. TaxID=2705401 RepID=UPI003D6D7D2C
MPALVLARAAQNDLEDIARYTEAQWGAEQKQRYMSALADRFIQLTNTPEMGLARDDIKTGYRSLLAGRHVIFYRHANNRLEISRVLHERMDLHRHLADEG